MSLNLSVNVCVCRAHTDNVLLLRGAVFYVSMSLWGVKRVETLAMPFTAVLPAVHQVCLLSSMCTHAMIPL